LDNTQSLNRKSPAYCARVPGAPLTTTFPFQRSGRRITNWESWFQPLLMFEVEVSGK
jgi:hypothetical protein